jgi:uncharacterized phiE125 gp8 family phage protein
MTSILLTAPLVEPISLADAKTFLRVADAADDQLITTLIAAARVHIEALTRQAHIQQDWQLVLNRWPDNGEIELPIGPFVELLDARTFDQNGVPTPIPTIEFLPAIGRSPTKLRVPNSVATGLRDRAGIEIDYRVGFGADASSVPNDLKHAMQTLVAHWYQNREAVVMAGSGAIVPLGFDQLIAPYRVPNL